MSNQQWKQQDLWNKKTKNWDSCLVNGQTVIPFPHGYNTRNALDSVTTQETHGYISCSRREYLVKPRK